MKSEGQPKHRPAVDAALLWLAACKGRMWAAFLCEKKRRPK